MQSHQVGLVQNRVVHKGSLKGLEELSLIDLNALLVEVAKHVLQVHTKLNAVDIFGFVGVQVQSVLEPAQESGLVFESGIHSQLATHAIAIEITESDGSRIGKFARFCCVLLVATHCSAQQKGNQQNRKNLFHFFSWNLFDFV